MLVGLSAAGIDPDMVVPFFNIDATQINTFDPYNAKPLYNISIPVVADFAVQCIGGSMIPDIPNGATVVLKKADKDTFLPGSPYLVVTPDFATIRIARVYGVDPTKLLLQPRNTPDFDEIIVDKSKISEMYAIKAVITILG